MPAVIVARVSEPDTVAGTLLLVVELLPSWPEEFSPQQYAVPALVSPHAEAPPTVTAGSASEPETATGVACAVAVVPLPSWPLPPAPQQ